MAGGFNLLFATAMAVSGGGVSITHTDQTVSDSFPSVSSVTYGLNADGTANGTTVTSGTYFLENYCSPTANASALEVQVTFTGTTPTGSATGSFLPLSSTRSWGITRGSVGTSTSTLTVQIREIANPANTVTRTISLSATVI
jgi:hypothetical protein